ncbi:MAG: Bro-N domain-containing protein [Thermoguttaceae bacterium]|nr:Bro-N domain-containing protein [Thermoguttaceae bacterium]
MVDNIQNERQLQVIDSRDVLGRRFEVYGTFEEPLFLAKDVAEMIEHEDVSSMLRNIDEDEKMVLRLLSGELGGNPNKWFLTENGLYEVLFQSRKPIAKAFKAEVKKILKELRLRGRVERGGGDGRFGELQLLPIETLAAPFGVGGDPRDVRPKVERVLVSLGLWFDGTPTKTGLENGAFRRVDAISEGVESVEYRLTRDGYAYVVGLRALQAPAKTTAAVASLAVEEDEPPKSPEEIALEAAKRWIASLDADFFWRAVFVRRFQRLGKRARDKVLQTLLDSEFIVEDKVRKEGSQKLSTRYSRRRRTLR